MKTKRKKSKKLILVLLSVTIFTTYFLLEGGGKVTVQSRESINLTNFWETKILGVQNKLSHSTYPIQCINDRFTTVAQTIQKKYGTPLKVVARMDYNPAGTNVFAACWMENGQPVAKISVPSLADLWFELKAGDQRWEEEWEIVFATTLVHELEHMANDERIQSDRFESLVMEEEDAWAKTCIYCLDPLIKGGYPIHPKMRADYDVWVRCGSAIGPQWHEYIKRKYRGFK